MAKQRAKDSLEQFNDFARTSGKNEARVQQVGAIDFALKKSLADALCILAQTGPEGVFIGVTIKEWIDDDGSSQMVFSPLEEASEEFLTKTWKIFKEYVDKICSMTKSASDFEQTEYVLEDPDKKYEFELCYTPETLLSKLRYDYYIQTQNQTLIIDKEELSTLHACLHFSRALLERVENYGGYLSPHELH